jgi:hypothetical protein
MQITTAISSEALSQIPFDSFVTYSGAAEKRWMQGIPPFGEPRTQHRSTSRVTCRSDSAPRVRN